MNIKKGIAARLRKSDQMHCRFNSGHTLNNVRCESLSRDQFEQRAGDYLKSKRTVQIWEGINKVLIYSTK